MRKVNFQNEHYYHIYNRGADKRAVFSDKQDYLRFLESLREFNRTENISSLHEYRLKRESDSQKGVGLLPLVGIICYCLNPNHFHLLLKQLVNNGISKYMQKLSTGYTNYFNKKYNHSGVLFQGKYKIKEITADGHLFYLSAYINGNPEIHKIGRAENWPWSSCLDYLNARNGGLCDKAEVLKEFSGVDEYKELMYNIIKESTERKEEIKKLLLE